MQGTVSDVASGRDIGGYADEFALDVRVIEEVRPGDSSMLQATSDNCGSTCSGTACTTAVSYPA
jgi:FxLD family lantipeptide